MNNKIKKNILIAIVLTCLVLGGLFFAIRKTISIEADNLATKNSQAQNKAVTADEKVEPIKILFVGDMMFDRYIRQVSDRNGYDFVFRKVENLLKGNDLVVGNLEGPITDNKSVSVDSVIGEKNNYVFTFDQRVPAALAKENIKLVNIGNNHISNFGSSGIESTRKYLAQSSIDFFGDPEKEDGRLIVKTLKNFKIAFVNYNQFVPGAEQKTNADISKAKILQADVVVLYAHWGKEFENEPADKLKSLAHEFIDNGADLIIGSHPHVVQPKEEYNGKLIYYSLGNFIFDQYFDLNTQKGMAVQIEINQKSKKIVSKEFQITMDNSGQTLQK